MNHKLIPPTRLIIIILLALLTLPLGAAGAADESSSYDILLQSRTIQPTPGLDANVNTRQTRWHGLIQFEKLPDEQTRALLTRHGVELLTYVPNLTWIATLPADSASLTQIPGVRWIGALEPSDKIAPALLNASFVDGLTAEDGRVQVWLQLFKDVDWETSCQQLSTIGAVILSQDPKTREMVVAIEPAKIRHIAAHDAVAWVLEARTDREMLNYESRVAANAVELQAPPFNLSGSDIQIGIWDGGVVDNHPDFGGRLTVVDQAADVNKHATHVAGTLAGDGSGGPAAGATAETYRGYADGAQIFSYYWSGPTAAHDDAINQYGIDVSQNSWGYTSCSIFGRYSIYADQYDNIISGQYGRGIPVVFAAGNSNGACDVTYGSILGGPASAKNVISVGSINEQASDVAGNSSRGPTVDGRLKPEIVAVGLQVQSTCLSGTYCAYNGTSMAAPAVSGSIALLAEQYANVCPANSSPWETALPAVYRALLIHAAQDMNDPARAHLNPGPDFSSGYGRLDAAAAVDLLPSHAVGYLSDGAVQEYTITLATTEDLQVTLAWDDAPAAYNAAVAIINDLDLEVVGPDGTTYGPWQLDPANPQAPAVRPTWSGSQQAQPDTRNVVEQVAIDGAAPGTYTVRVRGSHVPAGPQSFALVSEHLAPTDVDCQDNSLSVGELDGGLDGADVLLHWAHDDANESYEIWIHSSWDIAPDLNQGTLLATVDAAGAAAGSNLTYRHSGAVGDTPNDAYYAIRARSGQSASAISNVLGKIDTELQAGANNWVTLYDGAIASAAELMSDIEAHSSAPLTVSNVEQYLESADSFRLFAVTPFVLGNFDTTTGESYRVAVTFDGAAGSAIYAQVGQIPAGGLPGAQNAPLTTATVNYHYGQLSNNPGDTRYVAWLGDGPAPAEILTDDAFNAGDGSGLGFSNSYWMLNLSNFSTPPTDEESLQMTFGDGQTMWRHNSTVNTPSNHGTIATAGSDNRPIINSVINAGDLKYVSWTGAPGTYLVYRSQTGSGLTNNASNGRFTYLGTVTTTTDFGEFVDDTPLTSWYVVVPATGDGYISGAPSPEQSSYSSPTAIALGGFSAAANDESGLAVALLFLLVGSAALMTAVGYHRRLR